ncbi:MAG: tetratricopeptide (TPR) repeat protein [Planctomycetota bacterium]
MLTPASSAPVLTSASSAPVLTSASSAPAAGAMIPGAGFDRAMRLGANALERGDLVGARDYIRSAQERDPNSTEAWALRVRWAQVVADRDEEVYALHRQLALSEAQGLAKKKLSLLREQLLAIDNLATSTFKLRERFVEKLAALAKKYEDEERRHSAIRVHKQVLALDPDNADSQAAIERIAAAPDPSLAGDAKPRDLMEDISAEWVAEHDAEHNTWKTRAKLKRENYVTHTDAGYEVLIRCAEAMEQMNAFYRQFFHYATEEDGGAVSRIDLNIFKDRDEYLTLGIGPPVDWSAGHFTGNAVETYIDSGGFESTTGVLFHEAAHQFVSLATSAAGWLNEGLASFFEGCRILSNGTVLMNLPASGRLFPLATRMERGWMSDANDGIDPEDASGSTPENSPTFRIVLENRYAWGPPWYAPTWGVVYFLYNYQDPWDGRFVYRSNFQTFINASGGRMGDGAVRNFEEVVLLNPAEPTKGVERPDDAPEVELPTTVAELDEVWKTYIIRLRDEQSGRMEIDRPYLRWGEFAVMRGDFLDAKEHFEKGLIAHPRDPELHERFAELLAGELEDTDRATKLYLRTLALLEGIEEPDEKRITKLERLINRLDGRQRTLAKVREEIEEAATLLVADYQASEHHMMAMDLAWRLGNDLQMPALFDEFEESVRISGKSLAMWRLAYNEEDLKGWSNINTEDTAFVADGLVLQGSYGERSAGDFTYRLMTLDKITSGDFSVEVEIQAERRDVSFAGVVFGRKSSSDFHAFTLFPPGLDGEGEMRTGFVDLVSFYGSGNFDTWRHEPVPATGHESESTTGRWFRLRVDVTGSAVDVWLDGEYVTTQEFSNVDVLRGSFGLLLGTGEASFRNVRYLTRIPSDPGAAIERSVRLGDITDASGSRNGSWLGQVPPFPEITRWAQGERSSWEESVGKPQVLALFSIPQNDLIPVDEWLSWLHDEYSEVGLDIMCIGLGYDDEALDAYLAEHKFPGAVGIDVITEEEPMGESFATFGVTRFNLPRIILIDINGEVVWEGDPGFVRGAGFLPSEPSYLRGPLNDLVTRRKLREVSAWHENWDSVGPAALERGDLASVLPLLEEARKLTASGELGVMYAASSLRAAIESIEDLSATLDMLAESEGEAALPVLLRWAEVLEISPPPNAKRDLRDAKKAEAYMTWVRLENILERYTPKKLEDIATDKLELLRDELMEALARMDGDLYRSIEEQVRGTSSGEELLEAVHFAKEAPARWLTAKLF